MMYRKKILLYVEDVIDNSHTSQSSSSLPAEALSSLPSAEEPCLSRLLRYSSTFSLTISLFKPLHHTAKLSFNRANTN